MPSPRVLTRLTLSGVVPAVLAASVALAGPASADVTGETSTGDVVLYDHCQQHPISYHLAVGPLTAPWRVEVVVVDPRGNTSEGTVLNSATSPPLSGTIFQTFCGSERLGTYTVHSTIRYAPVNLPIFSGVLPDTTFEVRPMATRTRLTDRPLGHGRHRLVTRVRQQDEHGYERANGIPVRLERKVGGAWTRVRGLTLTTVRGRAVATVSGSGTYRAVVTQRDNHGPSTSRPVRVG